MRYCVFKEPVRFQNLTGSLIALFSEYYTINLLDGFYPQYLTRYENGHSFADIFNAKSYETYKNFIIARLLCFGKYVSTDVCRR